MSKTQEYEELQKEEPEHRDTMDGLPRITMEDLDTREERLAAKRGS